jgi:hypothetical protein
MRYFLTVETNVFEFLVDDSNEVIIGKIFNDANDKLYEFTSKNYADAKQTGLDFINNNYGLITNIEEQEIDNP